jgi:hypothetical protein
MLGTALVIFAIGVLGGLGLASYVLRQRLAPWPLSLLHAALGAIGLIIVLYAAFTADISKAALTALVTRANRSMDVPIAAMSLQRIGWTTDYPFDLF